MIGGSLAGSPGSSAELATVKRLAHSHIAPAQRVQRAQIIWRASRGENASAIAASLGLDDETVRKRIHSFNAEGVEALKDRHRSVRPPTYTPAQSATVIATALTRPETLGLPFAAWTVGRLPRPPCDLDPAHDRAGVRDHGQPEFPPHHGRVGAGASALGDGVTAQIRGLSQPVEPWWKILRSLALAGRRFEK